MWVVRLQAAGWVAFIVGTLSAGAWLRRHPGRASAERSSRAVQALFFAGLALPANLGLVYPGLTRYDRLLGLRPLPAHRWWRVPGALLLALGVYLLAASTVSLRRLGSGANAFQLTKRLVADDLYRRTRNPMSLGYYLGWLGIAFLAGSTTVLFNVLAMIPAHLFSLRYFEETELPLRLGADYLRYKAQVPFLLPRLGPIEKSKAL